MLVCILISILVLTVYIRNKLRTSRGNGYTVSNPEYLLSAMMDELLPQMITGKRGKGNEVVIMQSPRVNFCEAKVISVCNAIEKNMQKSCKFYDRASYGDQCMFFHSDEFCDNPEAQEHARNHATD